MGLRMARLCFASCLAWLLLGMPLQARCCPGCEQDRATTLAAEYDKAMMVLVGHFANAKLVEGKSDFIVEKALKSHPFLQANKAKTPDGMNIIAVPTFMPQAKDKFLVFCEIYKDTADPYRGIKLESGSQLLKYMTGAVALKDRPLAERLRYAFDYLNSDDAEVARDAYRAFARTEYKDLMPLGPKLPAETLVKWLNDPNTPPFRYGLYSSLLGLCGKPEHGKILRAMIEHPEKRKGSGVDGMLVGYLALQPKEAWSYLTDLLKDDRQDFLIRYSGLRTLRFLWDYPKLVSRNDVVDGLGLVLAHPDVADFAIEDLRKWQRWEMADKVLDLFGKKSHDVGVVKRAILRFALQCPSARATAFVETQRRRDAEWVKEAEESLKLESPASPPTNGK
jgi:hypothetical protein